MNSIKKFTLPEDWSLESPVMLLHERHPTQYNTLTYYMQKYYKDVSSSFEMTTYVS